VTVEITRCLTLNFTSECAVSIFQVAIIFLV
jgi:hypothetical protein